MRAKSTGSMVPPGVIAAVMLGTALSSLGVNVAAAAADAAQSVNDLSRYCTVCWRNARLPADRWGDCTQEVFARLLERVAPSDWHRVLNPDGVERREFLRAIDAVKKRTQRSRKYTALGGELADPRPEPSRDRSEAWESLNRAADVVLTPRQQRIVRLSGEGWTVPEIAEELHTTVERISDEKYKAIRKLRAHLNA